MAESRKRIDPETIPGIAQRLRLLRATTGMNQSKFARALGISPAAWNNFEVEAGRINVDTAMKLCDSYHVSLDWIYRGDDRLLNDDLKERFQNLEPQGPSTEEDMEDREGATVLPEADKGANDEPLTVPEAKRRLAQTLGITPSSIKIIIEA